MTAGDFALETYRSTVAEFHGADLLAEVRPRVVICAPTDSALVLGSRQQLDLVDLDACRSAGVEVVQRRSGGGAVLVEPDAMCWFDVVVPATHRRFEAVAGDVGASMRWLGRHVAAALAELDVTEVVVHDEGMTRGRWGGVVCFAGLGPGEIVRRRRKLVGISQRRTRNGSRFQCLVHVRWLPEVLVSLLAEPRPTVSELPAVAVVSREVANALGGAVARSLTAAPG